ncbi:MAG: very short patch repair endonuclease [Verrucomicrobia bacterium]|nr:very short patch repair endonuclease [Verrucomicrobiota bacterium]
MADVFSKAKRSEVMARIRSRGNKDTELALAKLLRAHRITGWRRQKVLTVGSRKRELAHSQGGRLKVVGRGSARAGSRRLLRVKPDFVFPQHRVAVFVDGCFWHGCPRHGRLPANNRAFWQKKLAANQARDRLVHRTLRRCGWRVVRIWEHDLAPRGGVCLRRIQAALRAARAPGPVRQAVERTARPRPSAPLSTHPSLGHKTARPSAGRPARRGHGKRHAGQ